METLTGTEIRDFRIRGNYFNLRSLLSRRDLHSSKKDNIVQSSPGYSPPVVEFELADGGTDSIAVSEIDIPVLRDDDFEKAKGYLSLILNARRGDPQAAKDLASAAQEPPREGLEHPQPTESSFVVPSTSRQSHSEQDMSQKGGLRVCDPYHIEKGQPREEAYPTGRRTLSR